MGVVYVYARSMYTCACVRLYACVGGVHAQYDGAKVTCECVDGVLVCILWCRMLLWGITKRDETKRNETKTAKMHIRCWCQCAAESSVIFKYAIVKKCHSSRTRNHNTSSILCIVLPVVCESECAVDILLVMNGIAHIRLFLLVLLLLLLLLVLLFLLLCNEIETERTLVVFT